MCLIVTREAGAKDAYLCPKDLEASLTRNMDGIGVMYLKEGRVFTDKAVNLTQKQEIEFFNKHSEEAKRLGVDFACHMRMQTSGDIDEDNCHPHKIMSKEDGDPIDLWLMHNGVLSDTGANKWNGESDTKLYIKETFIPLLRRQPTLFKNKAVRRLIEDDIGRTNKFVLMDSTGRVYYFNKDSGTEKNGMWCSNTYSLYKEPTTVATKGTGVWKNRQQQKEETTATTTPPSNNVQRGPWDDGYGNYPGYGYTPQELEEEESKVAKAPSKKPKQENKKQSKSSSSKQALTVVPGGMTSSAQVQTKKTRTSGHTGSLYGTDLKESPLYRDLRERTQVCLRSVKPPHRVPTVTLDYWDLASDLEDLTMVELRRYSASFPMVMAEYCKLCTTSGIDDQLIYVKEDKTYIA